jgi:hypothetical protein
MYLDALDEELLAVLTPASTHKAASAALEVEERVSEPGLTTVGKRGSMVRQLFHLSFSPSRLSLMTDTNRQNWSSHPSRAYSVESPGQPCARQISLTSSPSKTGDRSNSTSRSVSLLSSHSVVVKFQPVRAARFDSLHPRRASTRLATPTYAGRPIHLERVEPRGGSR